MALFDGLPVPKLTNPDELALQSREVMVRALTQGMALGQRRREHKDEMQERKDFREQQAIAVAQVQARKQYKMGVYEQAVSGLKSEKEFLDFSSQNVGFALDPDTSPGVQAMTKMFQNMGRVEAGTSAAKVKVTETHVTNRFNDDFELIASDPDNDELISAIAFKRQNPTTMPDPEMISVVAKAKQSFLQKQAAEKQALADKSKTISVGAGTKVINPATGKVVFDNPAKPSSAATPEQKIDTAYHAKNRDEGFRLRKEILKEQADYAEAEQPESVNKDKRGVIAAKILKLQEQYDANQALTKSSREDVTGKSDAPVSSVDTVIMTDKDGNQVKVPKGRVDELKKKGYQ